MPQCKLDRCKEEAVPGGKRYCVAHLRAYKAKQAEYHRVQASLPECENYKTCRSKVRVSKGTDGVVRPVSHLCSECLKEEEAAAEAAAVAARRAEAREEEIELMTWRLNQIEDIDDVVEFLKSHVMPRLR